MMNWLDGAGNTWSDSFWQLVGEEVKRKSLHQSSSIRSPFVIGMFFVNDRTRNTSRRRRESFKRKRATQTIETKRTMKEASNKEVIMRVVKVT